MKNKEPIVPFKKEHFIKLMEHVITVDKGSKKLDIALKEFSNDNEFTGFYMDNYVIIETLQDIFNDKENDWINYWMFELDCGKLYKRGMVTEKGKNIKLKTLDDLYKVLIDNLNK